MTYELPLITFSILVLLACISSAYVTQQLWQSLQSYWVTSAFGIVLIGLIAGGVTHISYRTLILHSEHVILANRINAILDSPEMTRILEANLGQRGPLSEELLSTSVQSISTGAFDGPISIIKPRTDQSRLSYEHVLGVSKSISEATRAMAQTIQGELDLRHSLNNWSILFSFFPLLVPAVATARIYARNELGNKSYKSTGAHQRFRRMGSLAAPRSEEFDTMPRIAGPVSTHPGRILYEKLERELCSKHDGKHCVVHVETGEYVVAETALEAQKKFCKKFGDLTPGWAEWIGKQSVA